jgi:ribosomal protein L37AE/L43A
MNPLYATIMATILGHARTCAKCGFQQVVDRLGPDGRYHCKKCDHKFTREELERGH